jgi:hypothetical protein
MEFDGDHLKKIKPSPQPFHTREAKECAVATKCYE